MPSPYTSFMVKTSSSITQKGKSSIVDKAHELHEVIKSLRQEIEENFLFLAGNLKTIRDEKLYKLLD